MPQEFRGKHVDMLTTLLSLKDDANGEGTKLTDTKIKALLLVTTAKLDKAQFQLSRHFLVMGSWLSSRIKTDSLFHNGLHSNSKVSSVLVP
ncbi:hypothetical protein ACFX13_013850 [Malus domestica]